MKANRILSKSLLAVLCCIGGSLASAAVIPIALIDGDWENALPGGGVVTINNSGGTGGLSTARWGVPDTVAGQSGYDFLSTITPFDAATDGTAFALGTFSHLNYPVYAPSLTSIDLNLKLGNAFNVTTNFHIDHDETTNSASPETNPLNNDFVTIQNPIVNVPFTYDSQQYYFNLIGFSTDGGTTITTHFSTVETQKNDAVLYGKITAQPVPITSVPDSGSSVILLGISLVGVGVLKNRNKRPAISPA